MENKKYHKWDDIKKKKLSPEQIKKIEEQVQEEVARLKDLNKELEKNK